MFVRIVSTICNNIGKGNFPEWMVSFGWSRGGVLVDLLKKPQTIIHYTSSPPPPPPLLPISQRVWSPLGKMAWRLFLMYIKPFERRNLWRGRTKHVLIPQLECLNFKMPIITWAKFMLRDCYTCGLMIFSRVNVSAAYNCKSSGKKNSCLKNQRCLCSLENIREGIGECQKALKHTKWWTHRVSFTWT